MTDTTDIKALREACEILNDRGYITESGEICSRNLAEAVRMIIEQSVGYAEQLEAERQRADKTEEKCTEVSGWYVKMKTRMLKAEAELAQLVNGERLAITDDMAIAFHAATTDSALGRDDMEEIKSGLQAVQELFTAPQKPVVLPQATTHSFSGEQFYTKDQILAAIEAAGWKVAE